MNLEDLKKEIPFKWRVQSTKDWGADCVAYIDARDVQNLLDEVCGQQGWSIMYTEHKNNLFCRIGITIMGEKVWKEDCGTESNVEKQKGEASDAFKRAAVMWGVGRFLYDMPIIRLDVVKNSKGKNVAAFNGKPLYGGKITDACNYKLKNK